MVWEYAEYVKIRETYLAGGKVDMSSAIFVYPTTLLPLCGLIADDPECYIEPIAEAPRRYVSAVLGSSGQVLPGVSLANIPKDMRESEGQLQAIDDMGKEMRQRGVQSAFACIVSEMVDNMYEHSRFERAMVLGQRYDAKGFRDISFFDDGMTIPSTLRRKGFSGPSGMIRRALNGASVKGGRGYGLRTTYELITRGLGSSFFIASGEEAVYGIGGDDIVSYSLPEGAAMHGTLITVRMPLDIPPVDIYDGYLE